MTTSLILTVYVWVCKYIDYIELNLPYATYIANSVS